MTTTPETQAPEITLLTLDTKVKKFSDSHAELSEVVRTLTEDIAVLKANRLPQIKRLVRSTADAHSDLHAAITAAPHLFEKPRTITLRGIKCGYGKGKGKVLFTNAATVVKLIRQHLKTMFDTLVKTTETPIKKAIQALPAADLARIGCTLEATGDRVIIEPVDDGVDKLVKALLDDATKPTESESEE